ncbi:type III-A CRISPR-associated RAMP protein Csm5 [Pseudothermotoga sp.]|nr:type III-A CRISPR-associated RAMP protein Csm5 [Pseudothermotoga sp.]MCX7812493.1 type III-A CRISPR-associated RAMP protein Csm5 [Pseudothermotoga sp.]MDW8140051.1 type III-A CRISPR-associated RAMP protein Csm5 [Pseudothermotoga sp.]
MKQSVVLKLKSLTPFFIGSGEKYVPCQIVKIGDTYYRLRDMSFFRLLHKYPNIRKEFKKIVNETVQRVDKEINHDNDIFYQLKNYVGTIDGEILQMIKHPSGAMYIPGSSIKGAIRTAIEYCLMKRNVGYFRNLVANALRTARRKQELQHITKEINNHLRLIKNDLRSDFARFLIVRDSNLINTPFCLLRIGIVKVQSQRLDPGSIKRTFLIEAAAPSIELEVEIIFDMNGLEAIQKELSKNFSNVPRSIEQVLDCVREMYTDVVEDELRDLKNENSKYRQILEELKKQPNKIHIGYGGGLKACSLFILLDDQLRKNVRNLIKPHGNDVAPLSRRVVLSNGQIISPIGWFAFQVVR